MKLEISYDDGMYTISSPDFPGVVTQADNQEDLKERFIEAVSLWVDIEYDKEMRKARKFSKRSDNESSTIS